MEKVGRTAKVPMLELRFEFPPVNQSRDRQGSRPLGESASRVLDSAKEFPYVRAKSLTTN